MSLLKKVIKANSQEHAIEIIKWWKSKGIIVDGYDGCSFKQLPYYGLDGNGVFSNFSLKTANSRGYEVIELPATLPKRGDKVLVWDDIKEWSDKAIFLTYIQGADCPVIVVDENYEKEFLNNEEFSYAVYKNYKPISKEDTSLIELTMDEALNELAKVKNVDVSRLRIKK